MANFLILGACKPHMAFEAMKREPKVGGMLPCSVILDASGGGDVMLNAIDPVASMQAIDNEMLSVLAGQGRSMLAAIVAHVRRRVSRKASFGSLLDCGSKRELDGDRLGMNQLLDRSATEPQHHIDLEIRRSPLNCGADKRTDSGCQRHGESAPESDAGGGPQDVCAARFRTDCAQQRQESQRRGGNGVDQDRSG